MSQTFKYIDLQLNGYAGVDFNGDNLTAEQLHRACTQLDADGVEGVLATVITDDIDRMCDRLSTLSDLRAADELAQKVILGIHIEGPFINREPGYVGAHPVHAVQPAHVDPMQRLLDAADGLTRIVTLAPECDPGFNVTRMLSNQKIIVSAGHCNPDFDKLRDAIDAGLSMFTHLGNGCPMNMNRHDNIIQRVLGLSSELWISFIADGAHIPFFALKNYLAAAEFERCVVVSDAISAAGLGPGTYPLGNQQVHIGDDLVPWAPDRSHLMGSACPLPRMHTNLREKLSLDENQCCRLIRDAPLELLAQ